MDGTALRFSAAHDARDVLPADGLLRSFVALATAPPAKFVAFARKWGRLYLCQHGLPAEHHAFVPEWSGPPMDYVPAEGGEPRSIGMLPEGWGTHEPIACWRAIAQRMSDAVALAASYGAGKTVGPAVWERLGGLPPLRGIPGAMSILPMLAAVMYPRIGNEMLAITAPRVQITGRGLVIGNSLASALAMQFALALVRQEDVFRPCSEPGCINPARKPRLGAIPYCAEHLGAGVRNRDTQQRHRQRVREAAEAAR